MPLVILLSILINALALIKMANILICLFIYFSVFFIIIHYLKESLILRKYALNLAPIFAALRHNNFFTSFSLHDKSRSETVRGLADIYTTSLLIMWTFFDCYVYVMTHNITLTSLDISGADISSDESWEAFGDALKTNTRNVLYHLNLSDNQFGEKGVIPVSAGLAAIPHHMSSLNVANTGMQGIIL